MKKLIVLLFVLFSIASFGQPIVSRSGSANTVSDARLQAALNFYLPRYTDTLFATASKGVDSTGAIIYTYVPNAIWVRKANPKRWVQITDAGNATTYDAGLGLLLNGTTFSADTTTLSTIAHLYKVGDSLAAISATLYLLKSDTAAMLANYALASNLPTAGFGLTGYLSVDSTKFILNQLSHQQAAKAYIDSFQSNNIYFNRSLNGANLHNSYIYIPAVSNSQNVNAPIYFRNRPFTDTLYPGTSGVPWDTGRNNSNLHMFQFERYLYEAAADTGLYQYGGIVDGLHRMTLDPTSTRWDSGAAAPGGKLWAPNTEGFNMVHQLFPGKKTRMRVDPFGRDGSCFNGVIGVGSDSTYNITLQAASPYPMPWSVFKSEFDFDRKVLGKQRIIKSGIGTLTGMGTANYLAEWKGWQGGGIAARGSYMGRHTDFFSHGSIYLQPGGAISKATMLAESAVDTAVGFYSFPKYNDYNEVINGWGFVQDGTNDANYFQGLTVFGAPWWPKKATIDSNANTSALYYNPAKYQRNVGSLFDTRSFVDKGYVDSLKATISTSVDTTTISTRNYAKKVGDSTYARVAALGYVTQAGARTAFSLTTTGTSGPATINTTTGVINIPQYSGGGGGTVDTTTIATRDYAKKVGDSTYGRVGDNFFPLAGGSLTGTGGAGFVGLIPQSSAPSTPASGIRLYGSSTGAFTWKGTNGFQRTFSGSGITADRTYTLPDATGTLALTSDLTSYLTTASAATTYEPVFNPLTGSRFFTDFTSILGEFSVVSSGTGTSGIASVNTTANRPGRVRLTTGTTSTGRMSLQSTSLNSYMLGGGATVFETQIFINTLSDATERYQISVGLLSGSTVVNQVDGVYFLYDEGGVSTGSAASANWQVVTSATSSRTFNTTSTTVSAAGWTKLRIEVNAAGTSVQFYINGVAAGSPVTATIPLSGVVGWGAYVQKSLGSTARLVDMDYVLVSQAFTTPR